MLVIRHCWLLLLLALAGCGDGWQRCAWEGQPAWTCNDGGMCAVVSEARGRLVSFGPVNGPNLLFVPTGGGIQIGSAQLHGGHQVWLGPQARWYWPPPPAWEAGAVETTLAGDVLTVRLPAAVGVPTLTRQYRLNADGLWCNVRWPDDGQDWQAIHILQTPLAMHLHPYAVTPTDELPLGCHVGSQAGKDVLPLTWTMSDQHLASMALPGGSTVTIPVQPLRGDLDGWTLEMMPVPGASGLATKVFSAPTELGYHELEQFSPMLRGRLPGSSDAAVTLRATPTTGKSR